MEQPTKKAFRMAGRAFKVAIRRTKVKFRRVVQKAAMMARTIYNGNRNVSTGNVSTGNVSTGSVSTSSRWTLSSSSEESRISLPVALPVNFSKSVAGGFSPQEFDAQAARCLMGTQGPKDEIGRIRPWPVEPTVPTNLTLEDAIAFVASSGIRMHSPPIKDMIATIRVLSSNGAPIVFGEDDDDTIYAALEREFALQRQFPKRTTMFVADTTANNGGDSTNAYNFKSLSEALAAEEREEFEKRKWKGVEELEDDD